MKGFTLFLTIAVVLFRATGLYGQCSGGLTVNVTGSSTGGTVNTSVATQPTNQTTTIGSSFTLTVSATGSNLAYQWKKGGVDIAINGNSASYTKASATAGDAGTYTVVVHGDCGADATSDPATLTVNSALPLEWLDFQAHPMTDKGIQNVGLYWVTASEQQVKHFIVERSRDGKTFTPILDPVAAKNTSLKNFYQEVDTKPWLGVSFYRIREVSLNGKVSFSVIRSVVVNDSKILFTVYPNPKTTELPLRIQTNWTENYVFNLFDAMGKLVYTRTCQGSLELDDLNLAMGFYLYECVTAQEKIAGKLVVPN
jgi:hypothetical protein